MRKAKDVEDSKAIVQAKNAQCSFAKYDCMAFMKVEDGIPQRKDCTERNDAGLDAVETAWDNVLKAKAPAGKKNKPMKGNR